MNLANVIIDLILIQVIVVIIIDISGVVEHVEGLIARMLSLKKAKVYMLECSFCMNHHTAVIYLIVSGALSLKSYAIVLVLCFFTTVTKDLLWGGKRQISKTCVETVKRRIKRRIKPDKHHTKQRKTLEMSRLKGQYKASAYKNFKPMNFL